MSSIKKILYITNLDNRDLLKYSFKRILILQKLGLKEIVFLQTVHFSEWDKELSDLGIKITVLVEDKLRLSRILNLARKDVSLVVVDFDDNVKKSHCRSIVNKLICKSPLPILFMKNSHQVSVAGDGLFNNVVFATDWSQGSGNAFNFLLTFKQLLGELEIVNVLSKKLTVKDMREIKDKIARTRRICLEEKINAEAHIYAGKISEEILLSARDYKASIIFMGGSSGSSALKRVLKGGAVYQVAEESVLPVFVIP